MGVFDTRIQLSQRESRSFTADTCQLFDSGQWLNRFFYFLTDTAFDFIWCGTWIGYRHENHFELKLRKRFSTHGKKRDEPGDQDDCNEYIDARNIPNGPLDGILHDFALRLLE